MTEVKRLLGTTRLLTFTGTGGCGKTRLAYQVAADLLEEYPNGVWVAELAPLSDLELVPQAVASALGLREETGRPILDTLVDHMRPKRLLLVLDNLEHLLDAAARLANMLLRSCPGLVILATSREVLGIAGETSYRVPSLSLPDIQHLSPLPELTEYESVRLFVERARSIQPSFQLTEQDAPAVAQVCWRLDGIPLAIELAVARIRGLSVEQLAARLDDCFRLLTGGSRTALRRQQTLRATIDWSYDLLPKPEKVLFRRLSVFAGGWTLEAAEAACVGGEVEAYELVDLLLRLVDRSLVVADTEQEPARYLLLETIRQYVQEKLFESGEGSSVRDRHLEWYLAVAERAKPMLYGPEGRVWRERLEREHDNLRAALDWSLARDEEAAMAVRLGAALGEFWLAGGRVTETREQLGPVLARPGGDRAARLSVLSQAAYAEMVNGSQGNARGLHEEALALAREIGDKRQVGRLLMRLGSIASDVANYAEARVRYEESLRLAREEDNRWLVAANLKWLALDLHMQGDEAVARQLCEESLAIRRDLGDRIEIAESLGIMGLIAVGEGDLGRSRAQAEAGLDLVREAGTPEDRASIRALCLLVLGDVSRAEGDYAEAEIFYRDSLVAFQQLMLGGDRLRSASILVRVAGLRVAQGRAREAARLYGLVHNWLDAAGLPVPFTSPRGWERDEAAAREALGYGEFARLFTEGQAMTLEEAVEYALSGEALA